MSGFDVQMRSDAITMPLRQRGAEMEADAIGNIGATAVDTVRYLQQATREQAESDTRIRAWETERQINQRKLMELQAVDAAEMGRLQTLQASQQVEAQRLQIDQARHQFETQQRAAARFSEPEMRDMEIAKLQAQFFGRDPYEAAQAGYVSEPGQGGVPLYRYNPDAAKTKAAEMAATDRDRRYPPYGNVDPRSRALSDLDRMRRAIEALELAGKEEEAGLLREMMAESARSLSGPGAAKEPDTTVPRAPDGAIGANAMAFSNHPKLRWKEDPRLQAMAPGGVPDEAILNSMSQMAEQLVSVAKYSPTDAQDYIAAQLQRNPGLVVKLLIDAGYRDEQIETYLRAAWKMDETQVKAAVKGAR